MDSTPTVNLNGFIADRVMAVRCGKCNDRIDTSAMEPLSRVPCPGCGHPIYVPARVGDFLLLRRLGRGGQGSVYGGWDLTLHRTVALKVLVQKEGQTADFSSLQAEAQAAAQLNHPHIAQVYTFGRQYDQPYLVMELVRGRSLDEFEEKGSPMEGRFVFTVALQVAEGLAQAAEINLLHCDIKPENIMIAPSSGAKLVDFGLAGFAGAAGGEGSDMIWGSPYYIAPERVQNKPATIRSDMYSLGATLYHMLTGNLPFTGDTVEAVMKARLTRRPMPLRLSRPDLPPEAEALLARMMATEPGRRHPTYGSLISDIRRVIEVMGGEFDISDYAAKRFAKHVPSKSGKFKTMTLPLLRLTSAFRADTKMPLRKSQTARISSAMADGAADGGSDAGAAAGVAPKKVLKIRTHAGGQAAADQQSEPRASEMRGGKLEIHKKSMSSQVPGAAPQARPGASAGGQQRRSTLNAGGGGGGGGGMPGMVIVLIAIGIIVFIVIIAALVASQKPRSRVGENFQRNELYTLA